LKRSEKDLKDWWCWWSKLKN